VFLFFSKLLPLFLYPLGLTCLLLAIALVLMWKRSRWAFVPVTLGLIALLVGSSGQMATTLLRSLEWQNLPQGELPQADAIVILGGALRAPNWPRAGVEVMESGDRVIYGAQLYRAGKAPLIIASGGRINWLGGGPPESQDMETLLLTLGVPQTAIVQEPDSLNTHENAVNTRRLMEFKGIKKVLLVTSALHMPRSLKIFQKEKIEAIPAPTDFLTTPGEISEQTQSFGGLLLDLMPQADKLEQITNVLKEYVGTFIYWLKGWV
jgi:uncharacterized SAM-binding protein YcdF (DUF218 family)